MSLQQGLEGIKNFDLSDLDFENVGSWPVAIKVVAGLVVFVLVLGLGYYLYLMDLQEQYDISVAQELQLKQDFEKKAFQAANLPAYKEQMSEMEESFGALLRQLPSDTEVPGLLEDITRTGLGAGLEFEEIKLQPEAVQQFYIELPIQITVVGSYHDLATFVSGVAALPRIVTLHDFEIKSAGKEGESGAALKMSITAKTYRYNDREVK